jgi:ribosomal-protein-alanine N-acetyltransferase
MLSGMELATERLLLREFDLDDYQAVHRYSWGRGYATEAAAALLRYGFDELGLQKISATCDPNNTASVGVLRKIGMRQEAYLPRHVAKGDERHDRLLFTADREWPR